jgi:hypothetical protein
MAFVESIDKLPEVDEIAKKNRKKKADASDSACACRAREYFHQFVVLFLDPKLLNNGAVRLVL